MDKSILTASASKLNKVSAAALEEYLKKADLLVSKVNSLMIERQDIEKLIGEDNLTMMKDNHANHVRFMASIFKNPNPEVFIETVLWVFRAYRNHGFKTNYWAAQMNTWFLVLKESLSEESYQEIFPYYEWIQINIPLFVELSNQAPGTQNSLH